MTITGNHQLIKQINKSLVLDIIKGQDSISRAEVSQRSGLNKGTVSSLVNELINSGLAYELGSGKSSGGRRPVMVSFNQTAGYSIGIDLGINYVLGILTDLKGNIVQEKNIKLTHCTFDFVAQQLITVIHYLIHAAPTSTLGVIGIGIGVPGMVDNKGTVLFAPNLNWESVNLRKKITNQFNTSVIIENDANAGAYGEMLYGTRKDISNLIYVGVGGGIGTGVIIDNQLQKGTTGIGGEMGHVTIEAKGNKCRCGNRGCWELYASENALLEQAKQLSNFKVQPEIDIDMLVQAANEGNNEVTDLFNEIGEYLGIGLTNIVYTFNPELIIIGNRFSKIRDWINRPINRTLEQRLLPFHRKHLKVTFSELGIYSCALGSSSISIANYFARDKVTVE